MIEATLAALESDLASLIPQLLPFDPGVGESQLAAAETHFGVRLPADYQALYRWRDGERDTCPSGIFFGYHFRSLAFNVELWGILQDVIGADPSLNTTILRTSAPQGWARERCIDLARIPFGDDGAMNLLCVDLDPGPAGRVGQVIHCGRDYPVVQVLAPSLTDFLDDLVEMLRTHGEARTTAEGLPYLRLGDAAPEPWRSTFEWD